MTRARQTRRTTHFVPIAGSLSFAPRQTLEFRLGKALAGFTALLLGLALLLVPSLASAAPPTTVDLKSAATFSVVAGSYVTLATSSTVSGDAGAYAAITKGNPNAVAGSTHDNNDSVAQKAISDMKAAYTDAAGRTHPTSITGTLDGQILTAGLYHAGAAFSLAAGGALTLNGGGDPNAVFILQTDGAIVTGASGQVVLANQAQASNVFWETPSYVVFGANTMFGGTILASSYITFGAGSQLSGRALSASYVGMGASTINTSSPSTASTAPGAPTAVTATAGNAQASGAVTPPANTAGIPLASTGSVAVTPTTPIAPTESTPPATLATPLIQLPKSEDSGFFGGFALPLFAGMLLMLMAAIGWWLIVTARRRRREEEKAE